MRSGAVTSADGRGGGSERKGMWKNNFRKNATSDKIIRLYL